MNNFLSSWRTSVGMSILGFVCSGFVTGACEKVGTVLANSAHVTASAATATAVVTLAYAIFCFWYAAKKYPSFFKDEQQTMKPGTVSFLNFLVGGLIFGALWNHNLTRGQLGISHVVYAVIMGIGLLYVAIEVAGAIF